MRRLAWLLTLVVTIAVTGSVKADETITVSSTSSDIAAGLDLKAVAKIFASAKNLEEFESILNNPDSSYVNLDLNGDGDIDYIRVVETGSGDNRLIVLQAILAKDIYQDVASIRVVKDEAKNIQVTITGDEKIYGTNYVITPVYIYRPVIYDWFWGPHWYCWHSPYYWGYWPGWWRPVPCWGHDWYAHHIHVYHHAHPTCSFRYSQEVRQAHRAAGPSVASRTPASRTRYAEQSSFVPNRTSATRTPDTRVANAPSTTRNTGTTSVRTRSAGSQPQVERSTRSATSNSAQSTRSASYNTTRSNSNTRPASNNTTNTRPASYNTTNTRSASYNTSTRSAGSYSGGSFNGSSVRTSGGFNGGSVRASGGSMRR